ncbi:MAG: histidine phosphatase family protein [Candidatus Thorarchaeota archaeon]
MNEWDSEDWTYDARQLLDWISTVDSEQSILLMVRHSHREKLHNYHDTMNAGLTDLGKRLSQEMGNRIPTERKAHIFLSVVPRCYETAEAISIGFSKRGGEVIDMDPLPTLIGPEYSDKDVWVNLNSNGENVTEFVNRWADNEFEGIEPFNEFSIRLMDDTVKRLLAVKDNTMHIHVTHDLAMMCAKRILFDRPLTRQDRVPYLGGLGLAVKNGKPILFASGMTTILDLTLL